MAYSIPAWKSSASHLFSTTPLVRYHGKVIKTFDSLPPTGKMREVVIRIIVIALAVIAYPVFLCTAALGICYKALASRVHSHPTHTLPHTPPTFDLFDPVLPEPDPIDLPLTPEEEALFSASAAPMPLEKESEEEKAHFVEIVRSIRANRLEDTQEELKRLRAAGLLTKKTENAIDRIASSQETGDQVKVTIGRAIELKRVFQDKYYVFFSAQSSQWTVLTYLMKQLAKTFYPDKDLRLFKYLRNPDPTAAQDPDVHGIAFDQSPGLTQFMEDHINHSTNPHLDHEPLLISKLICADTCDPGVTIESGESSAYFLTKNYSVASVGNDRMIKEVVEKVLAEFIPAAVRGLIMPSLVDGVIKCMTDAPACGNLYVICIPKAIVKNQDTNILWRSHPFGIPCKCHPKDQDIPILEKLQKNIVNDSTRCNRSSTQMPQVRILGDWVVPEKDSKVFFLTPRKKAARKEMKNKILSVVRMAAEIIESAACASTVA